MDRESPSKSAVSAGPALAAATLALLLYAISLGGTYVYDDLAAIPLDPRVTQGLWGRFWTRAYFDGAVDNLYRPLVSMSYGLEWRIHGDRPWMFHLVNCLVHAIVAAAVAELTRRCAGRKAGYAAGLLFAAHPIHVEAVANIVGRAELMCALGVFAALILFSRRPLTPFRVAGIFLCMVFAILSKEQGMLLPFILLAFGWFLWRRAGPSPPAERKVLRYFILVISWSTAGYLLFREHFLRFNWDRSFLDWGIQPMVRSTGADRWLMPLVLAGHYTQLLFFPLKLSPDYGAKAIGWVVHLSDPYLWLGALAVLLWALGTALAILRKDGFVAFCLISMALSYLLIANVLTLIGTNLSERLMYLPSAFFLMTVAVLLVRLPSRVWISLLVLILLLMSIRTFTYARRWNDRLNFYVQSLAEQPGSSQLYALAALEYEQHGNPAAAETVLARGCEILPESWRMWTLRAMVAMDLQRFDLARAYMERAAKIKDLPPNQYFAVQERLGSVMAATRPSDRQK